MLKALNSEVILWLTGVCQIAWKFGKTPKVWQTGMINLIILIFKKGDRKQCADYRGILLLSLPGKVYAKCLERKYCKIVEVKLDDIQCGFRSDCNTTYQNHSEANLSEILGIWRKISLLISKKHMT